MGLFENEYKVENANPPKKSGSNIYKYKVTDKKTGEISYLTQKGLDAVKNQTNRRRGSNE